MNCRAAKQLLPLHAGHDLALGRASTLESHLSRCPTCTAELEVFRRARNALLASRDESVKSSGIWQSIEPRLAAVDAARRLRRPWYRRTAMVASVAAALLVTAMLPFMLPGQDSSNPGDRGVDLVANDPIPAGLVPVARKDLNAFLLKSAAMTRQDAGFIRAPIATTVSRRF